MISVIYVDDDIDLLELVPLILTDIEIRTAISGEEALKLLEDSICDVIVTDYQLIHGMNGIEFMEKVRSNDSTKDIPFIFFTGWNVSKGIFKGADYFLKGGDPDSLFGELGFKIKKLAEK